MSHKIQIYVASVASSAILRQKKVKDHYCWTSQTASTKSTIAHMTFTICTAHKNGHIIRGQRQHVAEHCLYNVNTLQFKNKKRTTFKFELPY